MSAVRVWVLVLGGAGVLVILLHGLGLSWEWSAVSTVGFCLLYAAFVVAVMTQSDRRERRRAERRRLDPVTYLLPEDRAWLAARGWPGPGRRRP